ncbi:MAG: tetratricopeptide repeat protein [Bryobacteraceae bacterium]|nr:tetratricopeptide repeat protein [Bryobacteraceae bacterium]
MFSLRAAILALLLLVFCTGCARTPTAYVATGNKLYDQGKYEEAALNYRNAIQRDARFADAYYRLGLTSLRLRKPREAMPLFSSAVDFDPNHQDARDQLTDLVLTAYLQSKNRPQALLDRLTKLESEYFARDRNSFNGHRIHAFRAMTDLKADEALASFEKALQLRPGHPDVSLAMFTLLRARDDTTRAEPLLRDAIARNPQTSELYDALFLYYSGLNRQQDAERVLLDHIQRAPKSLDAALRLARFYSATRQYDRMNQSLQRILDRPADYPTGRLEVIEFFAGQGNWKEAAEQIDLGIKLDPNNKLAYERERIRALILQNKASEALQAAGELLKESPKDEVALHSRATLYLKAGRLKDARPDLELLTSLSPADPVYKFKLARLHHLQGNVEQARQLYNDSSRLRRNYLPPRLGLAELSFEQQRYKQSVDFLNAVLAVDPPNPYARVMLAASLMGLGDTPRAQATLDQLIRDFPQYPAAQIQLGYLRLNTKRYDEAKNLLQKYAPTDGRALRGLAEVYLAQGNPTAALDLIAAAAKQRPDDLDLDDFYASIAVRAGKFDLARKSYARVIERSPKSAIAHARMAELLRLSGDTPGALSYLEKAASIDQKQPAPLVSLGFLLQQSARYTEARTRYEQALTLQPNDPLILNNLALVLVELNADLPKALDYAKRALAARPNEPSLRDTLAWVHLKSGNRAAALPIFDSLVRSNPNNATFRYHYAVALLEQGSRDQAKEQLATALTKKPGKNEEAEIRKLLATLG